MLIKIGIQVSVSKIQGLLTYIARNYEYINNKHTSKSKTKIVDTITKLKKFIITIIKLHSKYMTNDQDYMKELFYALVSSPFADILAIIHVDGSSSNPVSQHRNPCGHDYLSLMTRQNLYGAMLINMVEGRSCGSLCTMVVEHFSHLLTPYIYYIISIGLKASLCDAEMHGYYSMPIKLSSVIELLKVQSTITQKEYDFIVAKSSFTEPENKRYRYRRRERKKANKNNPKGQQDIDNTTENKKYISDKVNSLCIIDEYQVLPDEVLENINYYVQMAERANDEEDDSDSDSDNDDNNIHVKRHNKCTDRDILEEVDLALDTADLNIDLDQLDSISMGDNSIDNSIEDGALNKIVFKKINQ